MNGRTVAAKTLLIFLFPVFISGSVIADDGTMAKRLARTRAQMDVIREDQRKLYAIAQQNRRILERLQTQVKELAKGTEGSSRENEMRREIEALRRALRKESEARQRAIDIVIETLSEDIAAVSGQRSTGGSDNNRETGGWNGEVQGEYEVVRGDTLSTIAQAFGVSTQSLIRANDLEGDLIRAGDILIIPEE